ncbi:SRPBCC domain-containing protein [Rodentibacter trehalosifermentans]|uniref:SRPBCC domain-containing protein n=1 Tax=Rodentibacter trehalosifermentans TaxID=1908263 RepID=UPI001F6011E3|nr:SRPBCC domain-containing protein [Rodentibacter trehalosifermentans]
MRLADIWELLTNPHKWPNYYANSANIQYAKTHLALNETFYFETFGFPVYAKVVEYVAPKNGLGRIAWRGWAGEGETRLDVHHAWLVEELEGERIRILTQETQNGNPAKALAKTKPNPMINGHQEWLDGMVDAARHL